MWTLTRSLSAAVLGSSLLVFDGGFAVITRYILLDPLLIFFMAASVMCHVMFRALPTSVQLDTNLREVGSFTITEKDLTRAFSWLTAATSTFTFKNL